MKLMENCPICASRGCRPLFDFQGYPVNECGVCGFRFLNPQPDDAVLGKIYSNLYFLGSGDAELEEQTRNLKRKTAAHYSDILARHVSKPGAALLEIGCGWGDFLIEAKARGFRVSGLEYSQDAVDVACGRLGEPCVKAGTLEAAGFEPESFDVIAAFDVVEHVRDPKEFLNHVFRLLRKDGVIMLVTPALDSLTSRLLGKNWMEYKVEHLSYFSSATSKRALGDAGFTAVAVESNRKILTIDYLYQHFKKFPVPVLSALVSLFRAICPKAVAFKPIMIPASGILVLGRKA